MWGHAETSGFRTGMDLTGFRVEARDGHIGKVDKHSEEVDASCIVVDTGVWIFGKHVLLPAGTIVAVHADERTITVNRTKEEIKNAPEFDKEKHTADPAYHEQVGTYYRGVPRASRGRRGTQPGAGQRLKASLTFWMVRMTSALTWSFLPLVCRRLAPVALPTATLALPLSLSAPRAAFPWVRMVPLR